MTIDRLTNLESLAINARDRLGETHMELTIPLLLELIEAAKVGAMPSSSVAAYWAGRCADAERRILIAEKKANPMQVGLLDLEALKQMKGVAC